MLSARQVLRLLAPFVLAVGLAAAVGPPASAAPVPQTERAVLVRTAQGSGGQTQTPRARLRLVSPTGYSVRPLASSRAELYPGYLAPVADNHGLVTQARMRQALLGAAQGIDPLTLDFAGNRDGRVDVADLITLVLKLIS